MTNRADDREPQWGPSYAEQTAGHAGRQTELLEGIGRTLKESGNRDYTESHPVPAPVNLDGVRDDLQAVGSHLDDVRHAMDDTGFLIDGGFSMLANRLYVSEEVLRSIDVYVGEIPMVHDAVSASNVLLTAIGAGLGVAATQHARAVRRREEQLEALGKTLREGFEGVQEELADVRYAVEDGLADVAGAVHQGAERVAEAVEGGFAVEHRLLRELGISLERHTTLGHLQHLDLMRHLLHLHDAQMEVQRKELASIQATMRDLATNGRKIEAEELYSFALTDRVAGNTGAAIRNLREALQKRSTFAEAWYMLGAIAFENGGIDAARDAFSLAERYAHAQKLRVEEQALNALLELERFLRNESAWRNLLLRKYERKFRTDRNTELFEVLRTWLKVQPDPDALSDEQRSILMKELPRMIRESESCGVLVATQSEFAIVRPHLADGVERFGSWAYLFWDLNVIALRALCAVHYGRCRCCNRGLPDDPKRWLRELAQSIAKLVRAATREFSNALPVQYVVRYRALIEAAPHIHQLATSPVVATAGASCIRCDPRKKMHTYTDNFAQVTKVVPTNC